MTNAIPCGYGHKIIDNGQIIYTSQAAMTYDMMGLYRQLSTATEMLSELLSIPKEEVENDIYKIAGCDIMEESFKAVLIKSGKGHYVIPTLTETAFNYTKEKLEKIRNENNKNQGCQRF